MAGNGDLGWYACPPKLWQMVNAENRFPNRIHLGTDFVILMGNFEAQVRIKHGSNTEQKSNKKHCQALGGPRNPSGGLQNAAPNIEEPRGSQDPATTGQLLVPRPPQDGVGEV